TSSTVLQLRSQHKLVKAQTKRRKEERKIHPSSPKSPNAKPKTVKQIKVLSVTGGPKEKAPDDDQDLDIK
ncbi:unnamed protein product, partial [Chrysoparadoxa australica]